MTSARRVPMLAERKLTPFQGLLHAIWTDERDQLGVCFHEQHRASSPQQRRGPTVRAVIEADLRLLRDAALAYGPMLCADSTAAARPPPAPRPSSAT